MSKYSIFSLLSGDFADERFEAARHPSSDYALMISTTAPTPKSIGLYAKFDIAVELHLAGEPAEAIQARIYRVSAGLVELSSPVHLLEHQELTIVCDGRRIQARVTYCRRQSNGTYDAGIRIGADAYIRTETRIPANLVTTLHVVGSPTPVPVRVVDLSPSGVGMELPTAISVGTRVSITLGFSTALGEIRHCACKGWYYRAGIRLDKLIRYKHASPQTWTDLNSDSGNTAAVAAFEHSVEERQLRSETILMSFMHPLAKKLSE